MPTFKELKRQWQKDKPRLLREMGEFVVNDTINNFKEKSFEGVKWAPRKDRTNRRALLVKSGALRRSVRAQVLGDKVKISTDLPYAQIHNEGGTTHPKVTEKMRRFAWKMYYEETNKADKYADSTQDNKIKQYASHNSKGNFWKNLALTKKTQLDVKIPARPFLKITSKLKTKIIKLLNTFLGSRK